MYYQAMPSSPSRVQRGRRRRKTANQLLSRQHPLLGLQKSPLLVTRLFIED